MTQNEIREYFLNTVRQGKNNHALILEGDSGNDWKALAGEYAAILQCESHTHCGSCHSCQAYASGNHPDIIRVRHEKPESIGVDEIRSQLVDDILIRPYSSPYKVYLVDEAEKLTVQAQNALLKTIEEPPYYGVIVLLTTNAERLLPTIRSRCICLKTQSLTQGDGLNEEVKELLRGCLHELSSVSVSRLAELAKQLKELKAPVPLVLEYLRLWFRDLLVLKTTGGKGHLWFREEEAFYRELAPTLSMACFTDIFLEMDKAESRIVSNVNYELTFEWLFLALKRAQNAQTSAE